MGSTIDNTRSQDNKCQTSSPDSDSLVTQILSRLRETELYRIIKYASRGGKLRGEDEASWRERIKQKKGDMERVRARFSGMGLNDCQIEKILDWAFDQVKADEASEARGDSFTNMQDKPSGAPSEGIVNGFNRGTPVPEPKSPQFLPDLKSALGENYGLYSTDKEWISGSVIPLGALMAAVVMIERAVTFLATKNPELAAVYVPMPQDHAIIIDLKKAGFTPRQVNQFLSLPDAEQKHSCTEDAFKVLCQQLDSADFEIFRRRGGA